MISIKHLAGGVALSAMSIASIQPAIAQETTSSLRGYVTLSDGAPATGATVVVTDTRTGFSRTVSTTETGAFDVRNLNPGGPYTVAVSAPNQQPTTLENVGLTLGNVTDVNLSFSGASTGAVILVTASRENTAEVAIGPSTSFNLSAIEDSPAINNDIKDIIRLDPRVYLDESFNDAIQCAGAHPRFNSLTVDGIGLNDGFGLNGNGYPTERMPFPIGAINNVSVELAPFDVQYGGFTACNINAVTKSGTNRFSGSAFYDYTDDSLRGDSLEGQTVFVPSFEDKRYGGTLGGPIIPDRLFFFAAYEKYEGSNLFFRGPAGSGATNEIAGLSQANFDRIRNIAQTVYGYDPGDVPASAPTTDEKYLLRFDWNINDRHRAAVTYNYSKGLNLTESDSNQATQFEFSKHLYNRGAELKAYSGQLFSDWTDNFSTELRVAFNDVDFTQACVDGGNVGEVQIRLGGATVYLGCDDSRHSNDLDYSTLNVKAAGTYRVGDHAITFGGEMLEFDIFNLFVQHTEGEFIFSGSSATAAIDNFQNGLASQVFYGNARGTNNPNDAAASFKYRINSAYIQDEFPVGDTVDVTLGVRYDWYTSDDRPNFNQNFFNRYGFGNNLTLDGEGIIQPRFGITWDATRDLKVRAGAGLFAGGNPNVWVSNSYSNDGITNIQLDWRNPGTSNNPLIGNLLTGEFHTGDERGANQTVNPRGALWGVPTRMFDTVANATANGGVNAIDPDFRPPSEWKFNIGATYDLDLPGIFGQGYRVNVDYLRSQSKDAADIVDISLAQVGSAPDGSPIYRRVDFSDPDCLAAPASTACSGRGFNNDLILTNSDGGFQNVWSASIDKDYDWGLNWSLAYAFVDSKDRNSMTSSVAFSNWTSAAVTDINNRELATSNYEIPHRFTGRLQFKRAFFGDYDTTATLFGQAFQGRPFSFVYDSVSPDLFGDGNEGIHLIYVPSGPGATDDPRVTYGPSFDLAAFSAFINRYGLSRGTTTGRNANEGQWSNKFDLKLEQEFPIFGGLSGAGFIVIENIGNLINDDWGILYQASFPQRTPVLDASIVNNRFQYNRFFDRAPESRDGNVSFWNVTVGARVKF
ncbi:TonB-dependent receptor [bacterium]|nr:TonB-dependent receptor [bacterium]